MSHYYAKFKENPCVGTDASTPFAHGCGIQRVMEITTIQVISQHGIVDIF